MTPWTVAYQAPPSMGFSRQEYYLREIYIKVIKIINKNFSGSELRKREEEEYIRKVVKKALTS